MHDDDDMPVIVQAPVAELSQQCRDNSAGDAEHALVIESPYLTTTEAATYLRFRSSSAVRNLKQRGVLVPVGRAGRTDLYLRTDLDQFVLRAPPSATIVDGRPDASGNGQAHDELERRRQADQVPGHFQDREGLSRSRARAGSQDRHAQGEEQGVRGREPRTSAAAATTAPRRDSRGRGTGRVADQERRLRDALAEIEDGEG